MQQIYSIQPQKWKDLQKLFSFIIIDDQPLPVVEYVRFRSLFEYSEATNPNYTEIESEKHGSAHHKITSHKFLYPKHQQIWVNLNN